MPPSHPLFFLLIPCFSSSASVPYPYLPSLCFILHPSSLSPSLLLILHPSSLSPIPPPHPPSLSLSPSLLLILHPSSLFPIPPPHPPFIFLISHLSSSSLVPRPHFLYSLGTKEEWLPRFHLVPVLFLSSVSPVAMQGLPSSFSVLHHSAQPHNS